MRQISVSNIKSRPLRRIALIIVAPPALLLGMLLGMVMVAQDFWRIVLDTWRME
jgi:hypothetical protein